jgi:hypothetical protein
MKQVVDKISFFARFSEGELTAYYTALDAKAVLVRAVADMIALAPYEMELAHPAMSQAKAVLIGAKILTAERANEIFA